MMFGTALDSRLDKYILTDSVDRALRLIRRELRAERAITERRRLPRTPGALVHFVPRDWVGAGTAESYRVKLLP